MKTKPMTHQIEGCRRLAAAPSYYALGAEQGTGKTWMLLADAERQYAAGRINGLLVIAPKGVHTNWVTREIPKHLELEHTAAFWLSGASQKHMRTVDRVFRTEDGLAILSINVDAVNTKKGFEVCQRFLRKFKCMIVVDESQRIKNPAAKRTKRIHSLAPFARSRRIASGTLVSNSPLDLFGQYQFLESGLLGTTSFRAFTAEYAELIPPNSALVQNIRSRAGGNPQIIQRDRFGNPKFKNLDKLSRLMAPHTYRVLKKDCLDLPEKIYQTVPFELEAGQRMVYEAIKNEMRYHRADGSIDLFTALTVINKLRQITSGFLLVDGEPTGELVAKARMAELKEIVEDVEGQLIIFASFREELRQIAEAFPGCVTYHGGTSTKDRETAVDKFQSGEARIFVGNPAAAGVGLTLTAASTVIYYSCSFSLEERSQSEDRAHRIGTHAPVVYIDLVARDTIDERIANALQTKALVASEILGAL